MSGVVLLGIVKFFGDLSANNQIDFVAREGEIHALVGDNGAGKTTLMNILCGLHQPDSGKILLNEKEVRISGPKKAIRFGIGMIHQRSMLIPSLTVAENIVLGKEPKAVFFLHKARALKEAREISEKYGFSVEGKSLVSSLSAGVRLGVEILKLLYRKASILIFDEPTDFLTPEETRELFKILRTLREEGKIIIFVSPRPREAMEISSMMTVLRQGRAIGVLETAKTNENEIAKLMIGRDVAFSPGKEPMRKGPVILEVKELKVTPFLKDISFEVRGGEIFGVAGAAGNGQTELAEVLTGLRPALDGKIFINGRDRTGGGPGAKLEAGVAHIVGTAHVPDKRHKRGVILDYPVSYNLIAGSHGKVPFARRGFLRERAIENFARERMASLDIGLVNERLPCRLLRGGDQEKIMLTRELSTDPFLLVASQPTRGMDRGGVEFVYKQLLFMRRLGKAILLISLDLDEIMLLSDTIGVLCQGKLTRIAKREETTKEALGLLMAGASQ